MRPRDTILDALPDKAKRLLAAVPVASTREALDTAVRTKTGLSIRYRTVVGKKCRWVLGLGSLVPGSRDHAARFVGLNLDVTDSMEAECALQRMQSGIVHLSRVSAMGVLATMLAHELNQPLTAIAGFVGGVRLYVEAGEPNDRPWKRSQAPSAVCIMQPRSSAGSASRRATQCPSENNQCGGADFYFTARFQ
jgi:signal transduction histidine kinase